MLNLETAKQWYPIDDPVHGFAHIERVYRLAKRLAKAEGADLEIVLSAALLHDAQDRSSATHHHTPKAHHLASAAFANHILSAEGWIPERIEAVEHCIRSHRFRDDTEQPETLEAKVLFDADKLDAIGAVGAARAIAYAAQDNQPFFAQPSLHFVSNGEKEPNEPHSAYHEYLYKLNKLKDRMYTQSGRTIAEKRHQVMSEFFERLAAESRADL